MENPSPDVRRETASKLAAGYAAGALSGRERQIIEEIFRLLLRDAEIRVRRALAEGLRENPEIPRDVAVGLAHDVDEVAVPILKTSMVFTDEDLIEIVRHARVAKQIAIAERPQVSTAVSSALVRHAVDESVVVALVGNDRAEIAEATFQDILDQFAASERIHGAMIDRSMLPLRISERLVALVSERLRDRLVTRHELRPDLATELITQARERATLSLLSPETDALDVDDLVDQLWRNGRLTPTIVLRALCMGDMIFFEASLVRLSGMAPREVHALVHEESREGLGQLYERAGLPGQSFRLALMAVELHEEMMREGSPDDREQFERTMLERLLTSFDDAEASSEVIGAENLDYFLNRLCATA